MGRAKSILDKSYFRAKEIERLYILTYAVCTYLKFTCLACMSFDSAVMFQSISLSTAVYQEQNILCRWLNTWPQLSQDWKIMWCVNVILKIHSNCKYKVQHDTQLTTVLSKSKMKVHLTPYEYQSKTQYGYQGTMKIIYFYFRVASIHSLCGMRGGGPSCLSVWNHQVYCTH